MNLEQAENGTLGNNYSTFHQLTEEKPREGSFWGAEDRGGATGIFLDSKQHCGRGDPEAPRAKDHSVQEQVVPSPPTWPLGSKTTVFNESTEFRHFWLFCDLGLI